MSGENFTIRLTEGQKAEWRKRAEIMGYPSITACIKGLMQMYMDGPQLISKIDQLIEIQREMRDILRQSPVITGSYTEEL